MIKAIIFDLDGVIVDTAKYHFLAWRDMAKSLNIDFTEEDNEQLKGVGRMESLEFILKLGDLKRSEGEKIKLAYVKNEHYKKLISNMNRSEILPGVLEFLDELKEKNIRIALGSSSKNARPILRGLSLMDYFEVIVDGTNISKSKPNPEVFNLGAKQLELEPQSIVVFEDAYNGIEAAKSGGFYSVGVGSPLVLSNSDLVISDMTQINLASLYNGLSLNYHEELLG